MRCANIYKRLGIALVFFVIFTGVNKSYLKELYVSRCVPYNVHLAKSGNSYTITWRTLWKCETYVRYKQQDSNEYKIKYPTKQWPLTYETKISVDKVTPNLIMIVSKGQAYGLRY